MSQFASRLAAGLLAGACASASFAQEDAVIVQATRLPEDVRRLPASTTVISPEDIERSAARTLPELLDEQVGFTMKDFFGNNAAVTSVDLRGYGVTGAQNTLILLDGRRLNDFDLSGVQWSSVPISSIERIEILRGTGAVLYGDAASAGVVNIVTRSPLEAGTSLDAYGRAASYGTFEGQLYASQASGSFGINGSVYGYTSEGYRDNNRDEQQNGTLNLRWQAGEGALDLRFGSDRQEVRLPGGRFVQPSIGLDEYADDRRGTDTPLDYAHRDGLRAGVGFRQRFGTVEVTLEADHREKSTQSFFDQGGFPAYRDDGLDYDSFTPRARVPFSLAGMQHQLILGADWYVWRFDSDRTDRPRNISRPTNRVAVRQATAGYYLQDRIDIASRTTATVGWRTERAKYSGDDEVDPGAPACVFCAAAPSVDEKQKAKAWELGLRRSFGAGWSVFARRGRSFRFVNAEEIYENDAFFQPQFQVLRPQSALTSEGGIEWRRSGHALRATLFRTDVSNEIHLDPFTTGVGNTNLPPSRRQGLELDGRWQASARLSFSGGYAYTDARFLEGVLPGSPFAIGTDLSIDGKTVLLVPRHKLNAGMAWEARPGTQLSAAFTALSSQVMDNDEPNTLEQRIPSFAVLDLKLAQEESWGRLSLTVNNVFDKHYYTYAVRSAFTPDRFAVYPLPGRTIGVMAELRL